MSLLPSDQTVLGNLTVAGNIVSFTNTVSTDAYGDLQTTSRSSFMDAYSPFGLSELRDEVVTEGSSSSVTKDAGNAELEMTVSSDADDKAALRTKKRGKYVAGNSAEAMIAIRLGHSSFSEGQECAWGYFDDDDGFAFFFDDSGLHACAIKDGVREGVTARSDFNIDKLDGDGPSRHIFDPTKGYVWKIAFSSVYGAVMFRLVVDDALGNQVIQTVHRHTSSSGMAVTNNLNLPVSVVLKQGGGSSPESRTVYVGERQYSIVGGSCASNSRTTSAYVLNRTVNRSGGFVPLLSVRRKEGWRSSGAVIKLSSLDVTSSNECAFQVRTGASLSDGTDFGDVPDTKQDETALEMDASSGAFEEGITLFTGVIPCSPNSGRSATHVQSKELDCHLEGGDVFTLAVDSYLVDTSRITAVLRFTEEW